MTEETPKKPSSYAFRWRVFLAFCISLVTLVAVGVRYPDATIIQGALTALVTITGYQLGGSNAIAARNDK